MLDEIPLGVSAGGVSEEGGSESGAGSRWVDSSDDDEGNQGVQEDAGDSGDAVGGGVHGSGTGVGGDDPRAAKGGRKSLDSEEIATAGGKENGGREEENVSIRSAENSDVY